MITVSIHHENDFVRQETSGDYVVEWSGAGDIELRGFNVTSQQTFTAARRDRHRRPDDRHLGLRRQA